MSVLDQPVSATERVTHLRQMVTAGAPVSASELLEAETAERLELLRAAGAAQRAREQAEADAACRLQAARDDIQARWGRAHDPHRFDRVAELRAVAVQAAVAYLAEVQSEVDVWHALVDEAIAAGFRADHQVPGPLRNPISQLGHAVLTETRVAVPGMATTTMLDSRVSVWEA